MYASESIRVGTFVFGRSGTTRPDGRKEIAMETRWAEGSGSDWYKDEFGDPRIVVGSEVILGWRGDYGVHAGCVPEKQRMIGTRTTVTVTVADRIQCSEHWTWRRRDCVLLTEEKKVALGRVLHRWKRGDLFYPTVDYWLKRAGFVDRDRGIIKTQENWDRLHQILDMPRSPVRSAEPEVDLHFGPQDPWTFSCINKCQAEIESVMSGDDRFWGPSQKDCAAALIRINMAAHRTATEQAKVRAEGELRYVLAGQRMPVDAVNNVREILRGSPEMSDRRTLSVAISEIRRLGGKVPWDKDERAEDMSGEDHFRAWRDWHDKPKAV